MSVSTLPNKRRRLNDGVSGLSKPFKSPLKVAVRPGKECGGAGHTSKDQQPENDPAAIPDSRGTKIPPTMTSTTKPASKHSSSEHLKKDPQLITLQKQHSALLLQLSKVRQSLDTAQQAVKIEASSTDSELEALISKWKLASREAAEEVFRGAKDRVNRMGGVGAWRERSRKKPNRWDDEPQPDLEGLSEERMEQLEIQKEEYEAERRKYAPEVAEEMIERDDDSFTMDMMLKSLNIELDIIGYDQENQRWCE